MEQVGVQFVSPGGDQYIATLASATKATDGFVGATVGADGKLRDAQGRFIAMGGAAQATGRQVQDAGGGFNVFGEIAIGALRKVGAVVVDVMGQALKATAGFVKDSIGAAGDFEAGMNKFQVVAGKGVDTKGLAQFRDLFIQLGRELPVSTTEVEDAATEMVSGGIDPAIVAAGGLRQTLNFAAASGLSLADAAATSAKFLAGWTSSAATTEEQVAFLTSSTDDLTKAAAASSTNAEQLRLGLFNMQGAAQELHVSFRDSVASLALLAPAFQSSAQAGTALNVFMTRLVPSTQPAIDAMNEMGLMTTSTTKLMDFMAKQGIKPLGTDLDTLGNQFTEWAASQGMTQKQIDKLWKGFDQSAFFDAQGNFLGMSNAAELLKQKLGGLSDAQKISTLHTLFGDDAQKVANLLMQDGAAGLDTMIAKMDKQSGVAEAAAQMQQGYDVALKNAKGSVEALQITIGSALLPVLTDLMNNVIAPAINTFGDMASAIGGSDEAFNRLSPTAQGIVSTIDVLIADVQEIIGAFNDAGAGSSDFASNIGYLASDLGLPGDLIADIVMGTQDLIAAFSDGGAASQELGGAVSDLTNIWNEALTVATDVGNGYLSIAQAVLPTVTQFWTDHGTEIMAFLQTTYDTINRIVMTGLQLYDAVVPPILQAVAGFFATHGTAIESILTGAYDVLAGIVTGGLALIEGAINVALDLINGDYSKAWGDVTSMSATFVTSLLQVITGGLELIAGAFGTSLTEIANTWQHNWDALIEIAMKVGGRMVAAGASMVQGIIKGVEDEAGALYDALINMGAHAFDKFMQGIKGGSPALVFVPGGESIIQGIAKGMLDAAPGLYALIGQIDQQLVANAGKHLTEAIEKQNKQITDAMETSVKDIQSKIADLNIGFLTGGADIDRQKAANISAMDALGQHAKTIAQQQLADAAKVAATLNDPKQQDAYFKARSDAILEMAKLQDMLDKQLSGQQRTAMEKTNADLQQQIDDASTSDVVRQSMQQLLNKNQATLDASNLRPSQIMALQQQIALINSAQQKEGAAQTLTMAQGSGVKELTDQIEALFTSMQDIKDGPVLATDPTLQAFRKMTDALTTPVSATASAAQLAAAGTANDYSRTYAPSYNMPVYTNNTPQALQQSFAVLQAMSP